MKLHFCDGPSLPHHTNHGNWRKRGWDIYFITRGFEILRLVLRGEE